MMRRRDFITLLGGAAAAWPITGRAQQQAGERMRRIGVNETENWAKVVEVRGGLKPE